jgi:glycosyltransferase involved in cell wall biosynthesis
MAGSAPLVSLGVPVFNGENYLDVALASLAAQTHENLEIIVCDNASTDRTEEIARAHAAADKRFSYHRNAENIGAHPNYHKAFHLATGRFFKWAAHDDWIEPRFVEACVTALESRLDASIAMTDARQVDENDVEKSPKLRFTDISQPDPVARFKQVVWKERLNLPVFGLMPTAVLGRTNLLGSYPTSARVQIAELALLGPIVHVPETLFVHRNHPEGSLRAHNNAYEIRSWYDTARTASSYLPHWEYLNALRKAADVAPLTPKQRRACQLEAMRWGTTRPKALLQDFVVLAREQVRRVKSG